MLSSQPNWVKSSESSYIRPAPLSYTHSLPNYQHAPQEGYICFNRCTYTDTSLSQQSPKFTLGFPLGVIHSIGFDKCIMTCISYYNIIQSSFHSPPKNPLSSTSLSLSIPWSHHPLTAVDIFIVFIILPFPECHIVGIIQYVAFHIGYFQ